MMESLLTRLSLFLEPIIMYSVLLLFSVNLFADSLLYLPGFSDYFYIVTCYSNLGTSANMSVFASTLKHFGESLI